MCYFAIIVIKCKETAVVTCTCRYFNEHSILFQLYQDELGLNSHYNIWRCGRPPLIVFKWGSITKWSENQPANWKIAGLMPVQDTFVLFLFPRRWNFTCIAPVFPAAEWGPGVKWENGPLRCNFQWVPGNNWGSKCSTVLVLSAVWGVCGTVGFMTSICETWTVLLWVISPAPGVFAAQGLSVLSSGPGISALVNWVAIAMQQLLSLLCFFAFYSYVCKITKTFPYTSNIYHQKYVKGYTIPCENELVES